jgi:NAD(P)-dependent dehydrogenase (short-subunit alcohol dehydrogenase family)
LKAEITQMLKQGVGGAIVNVSSGAGLVAAPGGSAYGASKHGVNGLTKTAAMEYAKHGIRVNVVCAGGVRTPMVNRHPQTVVDAFEAEHPVGRIGEPEEIAEAVLWLCSDAASFVTGSPLAVDGGWTSR